MDRTMVLTIVGFLAVASVVLVIARIQGRRETAARDRFIASHGWEELREPPADLLAALALLAPVKYQVTTRVVSMERGPRRAYFFGYDVQTSARDRGTIGYACLVEHDGPRPDTPIEVTRRVPLVEKLTPDKLDVEFIGPWVLVGSHWAAGPEEWEYLVTLTRDLAVAVGAQRR